MLQYFNKLSCRFGYMHSHSNVKKIVDLKLRNITNPIELIIKK